MPPLKQIYLFITGISLLVLPSINLNAQTLPVVDNTNIINTFNPLSLTTNVICSFKSLGAKNEINKYSTTQSAKKAFYDSIISELNQSYNQQINDGNKIEAYKTITNIQSVRVYANQVNSLYNFNLKLSKSRYDITIKKPCNSGQIEGMIGKNLDIDSKIEVIENGKIKPILENAYKTINNTKANKVLENLKVESSSSNSQSDKVIDQLDPKAGSSSTSPSSSTAKVTESSNESTGIEIIIVKPKKEVPVKIKPEVTSTTSSSTSTDQNSNNTSSSSQQSSSQSTLTSSSVGNTSSSTSNTSSATTSSTSSTTVASSTTSTTTSVPKSKPTNSSISSSTTPSSSTSRGSLDNADSIGLAKDPLGL
jgi:hypothetical protein